MIVRSVHCLLTWPLEFVYLEFWQSLLSHLALGTFYENHLGVLKYEGAAHPFVLIMNFYQKACSPLCLCHTISFRSLQVHPTTTTYCPKNLWVHPWAMSSFHPQQLYRFRLTNFEYSKYSDISHLCFSVISYFSMTLSRRSRHFIRNEA